MTASKNPTGFSRGSVKPLKVTEKQIDKIIELSVEGKSYKEISKEVNLAVGTIWRYKKLYCE